MSWTLIVAMLRLIGMAGIGGGSTTWALTAVVISGLVLVVATCWLRRREIADPCSRAAVNALTLRRHASRTAFLLLRDPDAAGRPRPRAPSIIAAV